MSIPTRTVLTIARTITLVKSGDCDVDADLVEMA